MNHGKDICRQLKQLRRDIADQNGIELEIPECTYEGDCSGTCPRCDYELRCLESELARRQRLGKAAVIAGTVLTMASFQTAVAQEPVRTGRIVTEQNVKATGVLKGIVTDEKTGEPLMACNVVLKQNGQIITGARTEWDGFYTIKGLAAEDYDVEFSYIGYYSKVFKSFRIKQSGFTVLHCVMVRNIDIEKMPKSEADSCKKVPIIEIGAPDQEPSQYGESPRFTTGEIPVQLPGAPASESGDPQPESPFIPDGSETNPLDNKK